MSEQILIIDDEWNMRNLIRVFLGKQGFSVTEAATGFEALSILEKRFFDLVILDIMMPGMDGWEVCRTIRKTFNVPILMLTARTDTKDKVNGLQMGADDYLIKPFDPEELIARVTALLRRAKLSYLSQDTNRIDTNDFVIDGESREVRTGRSVIDFTPKEFDLLFHLVKHPNRVFRREDLLLPIWGEEYEGDSRVVDTHIKNVREKLRKAGLKNIPIQTVWGIGYKYEEG